MLSREMNTGMCLTFAIHFAVSCLLLIRGVKLNDCHENCLDEHCVVCVCACLSCEQATEHIEPRTLQTGYREKEKEEEDDAT